jgi:hypothetical protein
MPCDSLTTMLLETGKLSVDIVVRSLASRGIASTVDAQKHFVTFVENGVGHVYDARRGVVEARGSAYREMDQAKLTAALLQGYSRQVVAEQAKRMGWALKQIAPNKFQVIKH